MSVAVEDSTAQEQMTNVVLQTDRLTKRFGQRVAVEQLSLCIERGDIYGFLGQNGAGKSTTVSIRVFLEVPGYW